MELAGDQLKALFHTTTNNRHPSRFFSEKNADANNSEILENVDDGSSHHSKSENNSIRSAVGGSLRNAPSQISQSNQTAPPPHPSQKNKDQGAEVGPRRASTHNITPKIDSSSALELASTDEYPLQTSIELTKEENEVVMGFLSIRGAKIPNQDPKHTSPATRVTLLIVSARDLADVTSFGFGSDAFVKVFRCWSREGGHEEEIYRSPSVPQSCDPVFPFSTSHCTFSIPNDGDWAGFTIRLEVNPSLK